MVSDLDLEFSSLSSPMGFKEFYMLNGVGGDILFRVACSFEDELELYLESVLFKLASDTILLSENETLLF